MKPIFVFVLLTVVSSARAQFYYKDIIGTGETADLIKVYRSNKVSRVVLTSYDANNTKIEDFAVEQQFSVAEQKLTTLTQSSVSNPSVLVSMADAAGHVVRTIDSSSMVVSRTVYEYSADGQLMAVHNETSDTARTSVQTEDHIWHYTGGKPDGMLRIKDRLDTTYVSFKLDDKGRIAEERAVRRGKASEPVYYYYNAEGRLTDVVRYNLRAKRLLPEYMFEYSATGQVIQRITVPENSSSYLIWRYQYDGRGLLIKEAIYDKQKQLTGKIDYVYSFGN